MSTSRVSIALSRPSNPPEQPALGYRLGARSDFLRWMLEQLPWQAIPDGPHAGIRPVASLATHSPRDPAVALLDAFAVVADVLTFYQERIANEGFLRTATETRSVVELARALGHELGPGLAAGTWLVFTVEEGAGAPAQVVIEPGVRVLHVPGQDELPQTFETLERIVARPEWNTLRPITSVPQSYTPGTTELWVDLSQANLSPGDTLLFVSHDRETDASAAWEKRTVADVKLYSAAGRARVTLVPLPGGQAQAPVEGRVYRMSLRAAVFGYNAPDWKAIPSNIKNEYGTGIQWPGFNTLLIDGRLPLDSLYPSLLPGTWMLLVTEGNVGLYWADTIQIIGVTSFTLSARSTAPLLLPRPGGQASQTNVTAFSMKRRGIVVLGQGDELVLVDRPLVNDTWGTGILAPFPNVVTNSPTDLDEDDKIALDGVVPGLYPGRTLMVTGKRLRARVLAQSGVTLTASNGASVSYVRDDVLFAVTRPIVDPTGQTTTWHLADAGGFEGTVDLPAGDIGLEPAQDDDPLIAEVVTIEFVEQTPVRTTLHFTAPLKYWYDRATTTLAGNVAVAGHGETVREVLGSGDGSLDNQRFALKRSPLTWVSAATPSGRQSTLEIRVDGVLWNEVSSLHDQRPNSRVYLVQRDDQGSTAVVFGDGVHGARLPTGTENVVATYRFGTGPSGAVDEGKILLFQTRPLGLRSAENPLPATGAEAPDTGATAKSNVPLSVLTLDRVVSVKDYETFARSFAGIGKSRAAFLRRRETQRLHVTLALADGSPVPPDAVIRGNLRAALEAVRDTTVPVELDGHSRVWFRVAATLSPSPDRLFEDVADAATEAMKKAFSFEQRAFGQPVSAAEVVALLQGVPGVESVDLDGLAITPDLASQDIPAEVAVFLPAKEARWHDDENVNDILPAELLLLDPTPLGLTLKSSEEPS